MWEGHHSLEDHSIRKIENCSLDTMDTKKQKKLRHKNLIHFYPSDVTNEVQSWGLNLMV